MNTLPTSDITSAIRAAIRKDDHDRHRGMPISARVSALRLALSDLERGLPSRDPAAFETPNLDAFGYATVLGFINDADPLALQDMADPVRRTIHYGIMATKLCHKRGLKIVKVPACEHIQQRYAKVTHVNAYPVAVLAEAIFGGTN